MPRQTSQGDAKTYRRGGHCAARENLCLPEVVRTRIDCRLHVLLPFRDRRVCRILYLCAELGHSIIHITSDAGSPSLAAEGDLRQLKKKAGAVNARELWMRRAPPRPLCILPSRALPVLFRASFAALLRERR